MLSGSPVGAPGSAMMWYPTKTCHPTTSAAGRSARVSARVDQERRGKTAANTNSSGPAATLVANGIHSNSDAGAGSACQNTAMRIGSTSDTVAIDASSSAPANAAE